MNAFESSKLKEYPHSQCDIRHTLRLIKKKKPDTKGHIWYDSTYMKCPKQANAQVQEVDEWLPGTVSTGSDH